MFAALQHGFRDALRIGTVLPLYLLGLLLGLVQTWPLLSAASAGALTNPYLTQLAFGGNDTLVNLLIANPAAPRTTATWGLALVFLLLLYSTGYNFISGGMLNVWAGKSSFWRGGSWSFWSFTGLGALLVVLALVAFLGAALVGALGYAQVALVIAVLLLQVLNMLGEYARAIAVVEGRRNPLTLFGRAVAFCVRRPGTLVLALLGVLLHGALAIGAVVLGQALGGSVLVVLAQQLVVFAWVWVKALRLAWALNYVETVDVRQATRSIEAVLGSAGD